MIVICRCGCTAPTIEMQWISDIEEILHRSHSLYPYLCGCHDQWCASRSTDGLAIEQQHRLPSGEYTRGTFHPLCCHTRTIGCWWSWQDATCNGVWSRLCRDGLPTHLHTWIGYCCLG